MIDCPYCKGHKDDEEEQRVENELDHFGFAVTYCTEVGMKYTIET